MVEEANQNVDLEFEEAPLAPGSSSGLVVDVDGFEGPLDVLLVLARAQKVDLKKISIVALVDQYLTFIAAAKRQNLELAADYLVMAAWLAYLKSRLVIPEIDNSEDEPSGEELAARLAFQLQRLEAMREAGARLMTRHRLQRDVFARGAPEGIRLIRKASYTATIYELLKAYSDQRVRAISHEDLRLKRAPVFAIEDARKRIEKLFGSIKDWSRLDTLLPDGWIGEPMTGEIGADQRRRSATASTFTASLELAKDGHLEIRQLEAFGPVYLRWRDQSTVGGAGENSGPN